MYANSCTICLAASTLLLLLLLLSSLCKLHHPPSDTVPQWHFKSISISHVTMELAIYICLPCVRPSPLSFTSDLFVSWPSRSLLSGRFLSRPKIYEKDKHLDKGHRPGDYLREDTGRGQDNSRATYDMHTYG